MCRYSNLITVIIGTLHPGLNVFNPQLTVAVRLSLPNYLSSVFGMCAGDKIYSYVSKFSFAVKANVLLSRYLLFCNRIIIIIATNFTFLLFRLFFFWPNVNLPDGCKTDGNLFVVDNYQTAVCCLKKKRIYIKLFGGEWVFIFQPIVDVVNLPLLILKDKCA